MGKTLILTEKESVALDFAKVLQVGEKKEGKIENGQYVITWCRGHLVAMSYPDQYDEKYKKWNLDDLPFIPATFLYHISVPDRFSVVKQQLTRKDIDTILFAGDAGREGEVIYRLILNQVPLSPKVKKLRVWIDSFTEAEIKRGIQEAKPIEEYDTLAKAGIQRAIDDYLVGMNFSRAVTCKYGKVFNQQIQSKKWKSIDIGRVMTCVLAMVVERERQIRNFKESHFFKLALVSNKLQVEWKAVPGSIYYESPLLYNEGGFLDKEVASQFAAVLKAKKQGIITSIEPFLSNKKAPLLYNLAELQNECTQQLKISPSDTLNIVQTLYEKRLTTYPRTDARVLSSAVARDISDTLTGLSSYLPAASAIQVILDNCYHRNIQNPPYTDDSKITDHYAIIPTGETKELENLSDLHKKVYDMIVRRFLSIFYPPACFQNIKITIQVEGESFFGSAKVLISPGYLALFPERLKEMLAKDAEKDLIQYGKERKVGDLVPIEEIQIKEGKTTPPKRYTSGSMILAMENAGKLIEEEELREQIKDNGIGTSATRAEILKKLEAKEYIKTNQKTQILTPHEDGEAIYDILTEILPDFLSPRITAVWENELEQIRSGDLSVEQHSQKLNRYIEEKIQTIKGLTLQDFTGSQGEKEILCKCPICKEGNIVQKKGFYVCDAFVKTDPLSCKFIVGEIAGVSLKKGDLIQLCERGETPLLDGFLSKNKKPFSAKLLLREGKLQFAFPEQGETAATDLICPVCKKAMRKTTYGYGCSGYNKNDPKSCRFSLSETIKGKKLSKSQIRKLLKEGRTDPIKGFLSQQGNYFDACLFLDKDYHLQFAYSKEK